MILRNSNRLLRLVNQLLDLSRLDSGILQLEISDGDVTRFLRVIGSSFESHAQQHNIDYCTQISDTPLFASFDHNKLETVVYNLLSNAFKFTPEGGTIEFKVTHETSLLKIEVSDNGSGIGPEHLPHIFDRFYQAGDPSGLHEGTGIGLSLVKELVSLMEGTIAVQSDEGKGTVFIVSLPLMVLSSAPDEVTLPGVFLYEPAAEKATANGVAKETEAETVLIVEDNADMRSFIAEQLNSKYVILLAANGREGLEIAFREIPDIVITDIMMPQLDGMAFCEALKKDERTSHVPVIVLTAKEGMENKLEGLETGADEYLTKPFDARELSVRIKNLIAQRHQLRQKFSQQITLEPKNISITSVDRRFLEKVESAIEKNISFPEFGVPQLQDVLAMSKTQFHRKMKALTDQPPGEFLRNYRLKRAAQLLAQQGGNITEIAFSVGFGSLSYFTRSFKDLFSQSPSDYIKQGKVNG
jgi:DNA-binding response OmpR family regulator/two-component sensor histidine kinase